MLVVYIMFGIVCCYYGCKVFNRWYNPITIYSFIWLIVVFLHQSGLIVFYNLSFFTWIIVIVMQLIFIAGCTLGGKIKINTKKSDYADKERLKKAIIITMIIASIAIIPNILMSINTYGINLLSNTTLIYSDRINDSRLYETIPYLGSFIYISISLIGVYLRKYGFTYYVIICILLGFAQSLTSGARAGIVYLLIVFFSSYYVNKMKVNIKKRDKSKYILIGVVFLFVYILYTITKARSGWVTLTYANPLFYKIFGNNSSIYKIILYICAPLGVLNEYLKECNFNFGINSFLPIYNLLGKIGLDLNVNRYQSWYNTPSSCNVGTWLRELIQDFTIFGALLAVFLFGVIVSVIYKKTVKTGMIRYNVVNSILLLFVCLSFFVWDMRDANMWIAIVAGYYIGRWIDKSKRKEL